MHWPYWRFIEKGDFYSAAQTFEELNMFKSAAAFFRKAGSLEEVKRLKREHGALMDFNSV